MNDDDDVLFVFVCVLSVLSFILSLVCVSLSLNINTVAILRHTPMIPR